MDSPDPLRQFFSNASANSSLDSLSLADTQAALSLDILPKQIATVLHQTTTIPFEGLDGESELRLNVDASPGCGGVVWPAGEIMSRYFLHLISLEPDLLAGKTVLELGAGTGLVALVLGLKDRRAKIWTTDQEVLIPLLRENIALNDLSSTVTGAVLNWGEDSIPEGIPNSPDYVLMADCVYFEPSFPLLVHTLHLLTDDPKRQPKIYLSYMKRRKADKRFFSQLHKHFDTIEVADDPRKAEYERKGLKMMTVVRKVGK